MSKERITIFLFTFIVIFTIATGYIYGSISPDPTSTGEVIKKDLGFWSVIKGLKNFTVDIPLISGGVIAIITGLGVYVLYREARGGL
jgi:hypothetical protein